MEPIRLSAVIVYYNAPDHVLPCARSIGESAGDVPFEIIVVDNASPEPLPGDIGTAGVRAIRAERNDGYAAGCNLGWKASLGELLLFMNPDTEARSGTVRQLVEFLDRHPKAGAVSCRVVNPRGGTESTVFEFPNPWSSILYGLAGLPARVPPLRRILGRWMVRYHDPAETRPVDWMVGCALMIRRKALEEVGGWDESYFLYAEEIDLFYRLRTAGWEAWYVAGGEIVHHGGASGDPDSDVSFIQPYLSRYRFVERYRGSSQAWIFRLVTSVKQFVAVVYDSVLLLAGMGDRQKRKRRIRARIDLIRRSLGRSGR